MYKFRYDQDNRVVRVTISGPQEYPPGPDVIGEFTDLLKSIPGKIDILVDCQHALIDAAFFSNIKKINPEPMQLDLSKRKIGHIGLFGLDPLQRIKLEMMRMIGGVDMVGLFSSEADALDWFKKDRA